MDWITLTVFLVSGSLALASPPSRHLSRGAGDLSAMPAGALQDALRFDGREESRSALQAADLLAGQLMDGSISAHGEGREEQRLLRREVKRNIGSLSSSQWTSTAGQDNASGSDAKVNDDYGSANLGGGQPQSEDKESHVLERLKTWLRRSVEKLKGAASSPLQMNRGVDPSKRPDGSPGIRNDPAVVSRAQSLARRLGDDWRQMERQHEEVLQRCDAVALERNRAMQKAQTTTKPSATPQRAGPVLEPGEDLRLVELALKSSYDLVVGTAVSQPIGEIVLPKKPFSQYLWLDISHGLCAQGTSGAMVRGMWDTLSGQFSVHRRESWGLTTVEGGVPARWRFKGGDLEECKMFCYDLQNCVAFSFNAETGCFPYTERCRDDLIEKANETAYYEMAEYSFTSHVDMGHRASCDAACHICETFQGSGCNQCQASICNDKSGLWCWGCEPFRNLMGSESYQCDLNNHFCPRTPIGFPDASSTTTTPPENWTSTATSTNTSVTTITVTTTTSGTSTSGTSTTTTTNSTTTSVATTATSTTTQTSTSSTTTMNLLIQVQFTFFVRMVDYALLVSDAPLLAAFQEGIKGIFKTAGGRFVKYQTVKLDPGIRITLDIHLFGCTMLQAREMFIVDDLVLPIQTALREVDGIERVAASGVDRIVVTDLRPWDGEDRSSTTVTSTMTTWTSTTTAAPICPTAPVDTADLRGENGPLQAISIKEVKGGQCIAGNGKGPVVGDGDCDPAKSRSWYMLGSADCAKIFYINGTNRFGLGGKGGEIEAGLAIHLLNEPTWGSSSMDWKIFAVGATGTFKLQARKDPTLCMKYDDVNLNGWKLTLCQYADHFELSPTPQALGACRPEPGFLYEASAPFSIKDVSEDKCIGQPFNSAGGGGVNNPLEPQIQNCTDLRFFYTSGNPNCAKIYWNDGFEGNDIFGLASQASVISKDTTVNFKCCSLRNTSHSWAFLQQGVGFFKIQSKENPELCMGKSTYEAGYQFTPCKDASVFQLDPVPLSLKENPSDAVCTDVMMNSGSEKADVEFWKTKCEETPTDALMVRVKMGAVIDFFKPTGNASYCDMFTSGNRHQWSFDGTRWAVPEYDGGARFLGGSSKFWPENQAQYLGDKRQRLSSWGSRTTEVGGCCSENYDRGVPAWEKSFKVGYCESACSAYTCPSGHMLSKGAPSIAGDSKEKCCVEACSDYTCKADYVSRLAPAVIEAVGDKDTTCCIFANLVRVTMTVEGIADSAVANANKVGTIEASVSNAVALEAKVSPSEIKVDLTKPRAAGTPVRISLTINADTGSGALSSKLKESSTLSSALAKAIADVPNAVEDPTNAPATVTDVKVVKAFKPAETTTVSTTSANVTVDTAGS